MWWIVFLVFGLGFFFCCCVACLHWFDKGYLEADWEIKSGTWTRNVSGVDATYSSTSSSGFILCQQTTEAVGRNVIINFSASDGAGFANVATIRMVFCWQDANNYLYIEYTDSDSSCVPPPADGFATTVDAWKAHAYKVVAGVTTELPIIGGVAPSGFGHYNNCNTTREILQAFSALCVREDVIRNACYQWINTSDWTSGRFGVEFSGNTGTITLGVSKTNATRSNRDYNPAIENSYPNIDYTKSSNNTCKTCYSCHDICSSWPSTIEIEFIGTDTLGQVIADRYDQAGCGLSCECNSTTGNIYVLTSHVGEEPPRPCGLVVGRNSSCWYSLENAETITCDGKTTNVNIYLFFTILNSIDFQHTTDREIEVNLWVEYKYESYYDGVECTNPPLRAFSFNYLNSFTNWENNNGLGVCGTDLEFSLWKTGLDQFCDTETPNCFLENIGDYRRLNNTGEKMPCTITKTSGNFIPEVKVYF